MGKLKVQSIQNLREGKILITSNQESDLEEITYILREEQPNAYTTETKKKNNPRLLLKGINTNIDNEAIL